MLQVRRLQSLVLGLVLVAVGCSDSDAPTGGDASDETGSGSSTAGGASRADTSPDGGGGESPGADSGSSSSGGAEEPDPAEFAELCRAQADPTACAAVPAAGTEPIYWCAWYSRVSASLDDEGNCVLGPLTGSCDIEEAYESGCAGPTSACGVEGFTGYEVDEAGRVTLVHHVDGCFPGGDSGCDVDEQGTVLTGPPECTCHCEAEYPLPS